jgi:hypothetical protein
MTYFDHSRYISENGLWGGFSHSLKSKSMKQPVLHCPNFI